MDYIVRDRNMIPVGEDSYSPLRTTIEVRTIDLKSINCDIVTTGSARTVSSIECDA